MCDTKIVTIDPAVRFLKNPNNNLDLHPGDIITNILYDGDGFKSTLFPPTYTNLIKEYSFLLLIEINFVRDDVYARHPIQLTCLSFILFKDGTIDIQLEIYPINLQDDRIERLKRYNE